VTAAAAAAAAAAAHVGGSGCLVVVRPGAAEWKMLGFALATDKGVIMELLKAVAGKRRLIIVGYKGGMKGWGGLAFFWQKGRGGTPFLSQEKEKRDILGNFGHLAAYKVPKYSKIAQNSLLRSF
jgi:hypothetical protein